MTTKKQIKLELNRAYESLQELSDAVVKKEIDNRCLKDDLKNYEAHSLNLKRDNNDLNEALETATSLTRALNDDNHAHTSFINAQSRYIDYLMNR